MSFIEDLLDEIKSKRASDEHEEDKKEEEKKKKEDDEDKGDEEKSATLFSELDLLHPELKKIAAMDVTAQFLADLKRAQLFSQKQAGLIDEEAVFNAAFSDRIEKLASFDPEFAAILDAENTKQAFNAGFSDQLEQIKVANNLTDAQILNFLAQNGLA